jgi:hypothetical protein
MRRGVWVLNAALMALAALVSASGSASADADPCGGYKWDVRKERALFAGSAQPLAAGESVEKPAVIEPGRLYAIELKPAAAVRFPAAPGKSAPREGTYAGVLVLEAPPGKYRVAIDQPLWVDLVSDGKLLAPTDYEGVHGCDAPRKIVIFVLEAGDRWTLQISAADRAAARLSITPAD